MNKYGMKVAACAIAGSLSISGYQTPQDAKLNNSRVMPAAGVAVALNGASTIQDLQLDVVRNIAYLESLAGLRPNIILASERVALAETPETELNAVAEGIDSGDISTAGGAEGSGAVQHSEAASQEGGSAGEAVSQESSHAGEASSQESSPVAETAPQDSNTDDSTGLPPSAGFSATDSYDNAKAADEAETEAVTETAAETETEEDAQDFSGLVIARVSNYVNVRSMPSEEGEIVGKLYDKSVGEFIEEKDGWYKITSGNCTGYVKGEYCVVGAEAEALAKEVGTTYAIVNTTTLKVRKEASTESPVLGLVPDKEELIVVEELDGWVKISIEEGDGYVSREYVSLRTDFVRAESKAEEEARLATEAKAREEARAAARATQAARAQRQAESQAQKSEANQAAIDAARSAAASSEGSDMGRAVIDYATQFVGNPYVYGGTSLTNGADCSGFVMSVYANFGVGLPHSSSALRSRGYDVGGIENAQPGDIVCYSGHVGLYVGNGQLVHASNSKTGIIVSNASYRSVLAVRRIF